MVDRARFGWVVGFCALWSLIVYAPVAHWVWGQGWLASSMGTLDFAGGIVVHTTAGVSALVAALLLGRRQGFPKTLMLPHSPALTMAGAGIGAAIVRRFVAEGADDARAMLPLCAARLSKHRHRIVVDGHTWEVDEFAERHDGLWLAEIELDHGQRAADCIDHAFEFGIA